MHVLKYDSKNLRQEINSSFVKLYYPIHLTPVCYDAMFAGM